MSTRKSQVVCEYPDRSRTTAQGAFSSDAPVADVTADVATLLTATTLNDSTLLQLDSLAAATAVAATTANSTVTYTSVTPMVTRQNTPRWQGIPPSLLLTPRTAVESSASGSTARSPRGRAVKQSTKASNSSKVKSRAKSKSKSPKRSGSRRSKSPKRGGSRKGAAKRKGKV
jgi:hypothetical protein